MRKSLVLALVVMLPAVCLADVNTKKGTVTAGPTPSLTLTSGGASQTFVAAQTNAYWCIIKNPQRADDQGLSVAERAYVNFFGTAAAAGGGASITLEPGEAYEMDPQEGAVTWTAATTGHKLQGFCMR